MFLSYLQPPVGERQPHSVRRACHASRPTTVSCGTGWTGRRAKPLAIATIAYSRPSAVSENGGERRKRRGGEGKREKKGKGRKGIPYGSNSRFHARRHYFMSDPTKNYSNYILLLAERIETRGGERHGTWGTNYAKKAKKDDTASPTALKQKEITSYGKNTPRCPICWAQVNADIIERQGQKK